MNLHVVDFLDIQFNLKTNSYKPYMKPNSVPVYPVYINKSSNHPPQALKELPKTHPYHHPKRYLIIQKPYTKILLKRVDFKINYCINKTVFRIMMNTKKIRKEKEI